INILLWFLMTYPKSPQLEQQFAARRQAMEASIASAPTQARSEQLKSDLENLDKDEQGEKLRYSFAGRIGHILEPAIKPLGFDWKIGVGIVASFAAREVFVSTMSLVYNVGEYEKSDAATSSLASTLKTQTHPDGTP